MKKNLAILLAAILMLSCFSACAEATVTQLNENSDTLSFFLSVPNGEVTEQAAYDPGVIGSVAVTDMPELMIFFSLMPDDSYTDMDMSELTAEDVATLSGNVTDDLGESTSELYDMPCGLKAMVIRDTANTEYISMALKDGYFFYLSGFHADFSPLSEAEAAAVKAVFDSLSYETTAADAPAAAQ